MRSSLRSRRSGRGAGEIGKKKGRWEEGSACNKSPNWFNSEVAGGCKIRIARIVGVTRKEQYSLPGRLLRQK